MNTKNILQALQRGILICNMNAKIMYFNDAYGELIGQKLEGVRGQDIQKYRPHAMVPQVVNTQIPVEGVVRREGLNADRQNIHP